MTWWISNSTFQSKVIFSFYVLKKSIYFPSIFVSEDFYSQLSKCLLYSINMARIRLVFVVFCIGSIYGLPQQDIANLSDDSKLSDSIIQINSALKGFVHFRDLTKNPIKNPSSSVDSKPNDLLEIVVFAMKLALKFIWKEANCIMGFKPSQEVEATISGNCYDWNAESVIYDFRDAFLAVYFSFLTFILNFIHNNPHDVKWIE